MKLSIFTTATIPRKRGDLWEQSLISYQDLADEVIAVNGGIGPLYIPALKTKSVDVMWKNEFSWEFIGQQFQRGYEACTGDWVIHADLDMIFHEKDYQKIRDACVSNPDAPGLSFWKHQFVQPDRFNLKSRIVLAVNKRKFGDRIRFDGGGDLCQPTLDGKELSPNDVPEARVPIWNYECILKTKEQLLDDKGRFARAWQRHFGEYKLGGPDDESAYEEWLKMVVGRNQKAGFPLPLEGHPKVMHDTLRSLKPEMWGYSGFGNYQRCSYV